MRHALPNALIPSVTVLGLALGDLLYGAALTETVFGWPGMGAYVVESIQALDFPAVMGFAVVVSFVYVLLNLVVDLLYRWIDPRITEVSGWQLCRLWIGRDSGRERVCQYVYDLGGAGS